MSRWLWFWGCILLGLLALVGGWLVPMHLRAVDASVLQQAGRNTPGVASRGVALVQAENLGAAELLLEAARQESLPDRGELSIAVADLAKKHPELETGGQGVAGLPGLFGPEPEAVGSEPQPLTDFVMREKHRKVLLEFLGRSAEPGVQELLRCRSLSHTAVFSPSASAAGQAFDAALAVGGLLVEQRRMAGGLSNAVVTLAAGANAGGNSQPLEQVLLDLLSLGQRLNWGQLAAFVGPITDAETLRLLAQAVRNAGEQLPVLFSAVLLCQQPAAVARYAATFSRSGLDDLGGSLRFRAGGLDELLQRNQRLYSSEDRQRLSGRGPLDKVFAAAAGYAWRQPWLALAAKWLLYLAGGFLLAAAAHFARPPSPALERPLQVRGFHLAREVLFALGFLLVVLLLSEPFLSQESQRAGSPLRAHLSMVGSAVPARNLGVTPSFMNQLSLLTLLLFFVLQALIYTACLVKLAEIRRQRVASRIKLKLLENEDHLFDAGLYLGFVGTIISLILVSLGIIRPSLMAAYSSTSFGIIFVSVFKIFHVRPLRRQLLLESETGAPEPAGPAGTPSFAPSL